MNKTLLAGVVALSLAFVSTPVDADHELGCTGTDPNVCHEHWSYGDGSCAYDSEDQQFVVSGSDVQLLAALSSYCYGGWIDCEGDLAIVYLTQGDRWNPGPTGHSHAYLTAREAGCDGDSRCRVSYSILDTNTGIHEHGDVYDESCDDTL